MSLISLSFLDVYGLARRYGPMSSLVNPMFMISPQSSLTEVLIFFILTHDVGPMGKLGCLVSKETCLFHGQLIVLLFNLFYSMRGNQLPVSAAWVFDMFCNFYLGKNHKVANSSTTIKARKNKYIFGILVILIFYVCLTKFKNNQILLNNISHRLLLTIKLFTG